MRERESKYPRCKTHQVMRRIRGLERDHFIGNRCFFNNQLWHSDAHSATNGEPYYTYAQWMPGFFPVSQYPCTRLGQKVWDCYLGQFHQVSIRAIGNETALWKVAATVLNNDKWSVFRSRGRQTIMWTQSVVLDGSSEWWRRTRSTTEQVNDLWLDWGEFYYRNRFFLSVNVRLCVWSRHLCRQRSGRPPSTITGDIWSSWQVEALEGVRPLFVMGIPQAMGLINVKPNVFAGFV